MVIIVEAVAVLNAKGGITRAFVTEMTTLYSLYTSTPSAEETLTTIIPSKVNGTALCGYLDTGSGRNFISLNAVRRLKLTQYVMKPSIANGYVESNTKTIYVYFPP